MSLCVPVCVCVAVCFNACVILCVLLCVLLCVRVYGDLKWLCRYVYFVCVCFGYFCVTTIYDFL